MTDDLDKLRDLARDLPWDKPSAQRRDAVRSSLLVEAAEQSSADERGGLAGSRALAGASGSRRWLTIGGAFTAGALAAAAIAVLVLRRDRPIELPSASQITASSEAKLEHRVVATDTGVDEIVEVHAGKVTLAVPAVRRGDHVRVRTSTAEVEGDAGELDVLVVADALQTVTVRTGTAKIVATGQAPVFLAAGQTWRASVITTDISPETTQPNTNAVTDPGKTELPDSVKPAPADRVKPAPADSVKTTPADRVKPAPADSVKTTAADSVKTAAADTVTTARTAPADSVKTAPARGVKTAQSGEPRSDEPMPGAPKQPAVDTKPGAPKQPAVDTKSGAAKQTAVDTKPSVEVPVLPNDKPAAIPTPAGKADPRLAAVEKQFQRGWQLLRDGKAREAAAELGAAADAMPSAPIAQDARYFQAVALVRAGDVAAAEKVLVQFLDHAPKSLRRGRAAVLLGRVLAQRGDRASARAWFESAVTDPDPSIAAAAQAGLQSLAAK